MLLSKIAVTRTWRPEFRSFANRLATKPYPARAALYNDIIGRFAQNDLWLTLDCLGVLAAFDSATALTNLVTGSGGGDLSTSGSPTFTADQGFAGAASKFVDSNFRPGTTSGKSGQNSLTIAGWSLTSSAAVANLVGDNGFVNFIYPRDSSAANKSEFAVDQASANQFVTGSDLGDASGFWSASRRSSTSAEYYRNGASLGTSGATSAAATSTIRTGGFTSDVWTANSPLIIVASQWTTAQHRAAYDALHPYMKAVAGAA